MKKLGKYQIVRSVGAGVFAGYVTKQVGQKVVMKDARRLWYWSGAASLSQLATDGTKEPENCKFPCIVSRIEIFNVVEILDVTSQAEASIKSVAIWAK